MLSLARLLRSGAQCEVVHRFLRAEHVVRGLWTPTRSLRVSWPLWGVLVSAGSLRELPQDRYAQFPRALVPRHRQECQRVQTADAAAGAQGCVHHLPLALLGSTEGSHAADTPHGLSESSPALVVAISPSSSGALPPLRAPGATAASIVARGWGSPVLPSSSLIGPGLLRSREMGTQQPSPQALFHGWTAVCPKAAAVHSLQGSGLCTSVR